MSLQQESSTGWKADDKWPFLGQLSGDSPEAQLTCPSSAKALLPYHHHRQRPLPPSSPLVSIFFSMAAQVQM